jgi:hypothetical protein
MQRAFAALVERLDIDVKSPDFREKLAPFAGVWAAMIQAAAKDFHTAAISGGVDGLGVQPIAAALNRLVEEGLTLNR